MCARPTAPATLFVRFSRFYYDNQSSHTAPPTKGLLTQVEAAETTCGSGFVVIEQNSYDPTWHNLTRRQNGRGYGTNYTYDSVFQTFAATERNDLQHTITTTYNSGDMVAWALGLPWQVTDANGQTTTFTYDVFGRMRTVDRPLGASVDEEWVYSDYVNPATPRYVVHKVRDDVTTPANPESGYLATWTFYDGLGRELQSQREAEEGNGYRLVSSRQYDGHGRLRREGVVYKETVAPGTYKSETWNTALHTSYTYSWTGQLYEVTQPDESKERRFYRYLQTATVDANFHMTIVETDGLGRPIAAKQYTGTYINGPDWGAVVYAGAQYEYDVADRLTKVTGPDNAATTIAYDLLGRKTQMTDPDMGTWTYAYDAAGNLIRQTDARGTTLCYEYDALNRLRYVREDQTEPKNCTGTLVWRVTHEYDTLNWQPVSNGIGRRNRLNDGSGTTTWTYDARGRVTKETKVIGGTGEGTFVTQWGYDALDRVATMTYPGGNNSQPGEIVTFTYNPQGLLERMYRSSPTPVYDYVGGTDYNALGQVRERRLGSATGVLRQRYEYPATENYRLTTLQSGTGPHYNNRQNLSYTYDDVGNILSITDAAAVGGSQTQSFTYDALNRLKTAQATGGSYGVYSRQTYTYTVAGNIESFEGTAFAYNDANHPHAVTHLGGVQKYWYDANGNMTRRINFGLNVTYSYDAENRLVGVSGDKTATFTYDGDGKLVKMQVGSTYVAIAGPHYQHSGSTGTKYYYAGSVRIAERIGGTLYYLLTDHLGSTAVTTDANGAYVTELRYMPYGKPRYNPGNQKADYRFTGQRWQNDIGLYYYNARWYDHLIGRFTQPDPLVPEPGNPQALNRYAYVLNNPLRYTDPTGHRECEENDRACWEKAWYWKNRWYNAHGYGWGGHHWDVLIPAIFADLDILLETVAEAGVTFAAGWDWQIQQAAMVAIGQGIVRFGQKLSGGLARLQALLGGGAALHHVAATPWSCLGAPACALPPGTNNVYFSTSFLQESTPAWIAMTTVHELAHVIDWHSRIQTGVVGSYLGPVPTYGRFSDAWRGAPLTEYAACRACINAWERWAEAVTVWVFPDYKKTDPVRMKIPPDVLQVQMDRIQALLEGWY